MKYIIIGCGRVGAELAYRLYQNSHQVTVIDSKKAAFHNLPIEFKGKTLEGEAMNQDILRRAGIEEADGLATVTSSDTINAVVGHIARVVYDVPIVVIRNYDSRWRAMHEAFGHQVVSSSSWGAQRIEELLFNEEGYTVFSAGNGEVELYEFSISEAWSGKTLRELIPAEECIAAALTRAGKAMIPNASTSLEKGDLLLISATLQGSSILRQRLSSEN